LRILIVFHLFRIIHQLAQHRVISGSQVQARYTKNGRRLMDDPALLQREAAHFAFGV